ncbi:MAG: hypothetical protein ACTHYZ_10540 [Psychrobacter sp.]
MWNSTLQTFVVGMVMAVGVSLSSCDSSKDDLQKSDTNAETIVDDSKQTENNAPVQDNAASNADLDGATAQQGTQVKYDVSAWGTDKVKSLNITELEGIKSSFGKVRSTDENSLDYASNPAAKYRFMNTDEPYLDVIDSEKYLELGWYFANPTDSDKEKELSQNHAKKAYKLSRQLMGEEGGRLIADMLNGQIAKNKVVGGHKVELAKCEFYSCMLILNKTAVQPDDS